MNYYLDILERSQSEFIKPHDKTYMFSENELIKALEYAYDEGMKWAYSLIEADIKKRIKGGDE